jgi:hypothetical protein
MATFGAAFQFVLVTSVSFINILMRTCSKELNFDTSQL